MVQHNRKRSRKSSKIKQLLNDYVRDLSSTIDELFELDNNVEYKRIRVESNHPHKDQH